MPDSSPRKDYTYGDPLKHDRPLKVTGGVAGSAGERRKWNHFVPLDGGPVQDDGTVDGTCGTEVNSCSMNGHVAQLDEPKAKLPLSSRVRLSPNNG